MSEGFIVGVDIGAAGALALITRGGALVEIADMPILRDGPANRASVNAPLLADIVARWHARAAFVEYVGARPGEGAVGAFAFGRSRGVVEGCCGALGLAVTFHAAGLEARRRHSAGPGRSRRLFRRFHKSARRVTRWER